MELPEGYLEKFKIKRGAHRLQEIIDRIISMDKGAHQYRYWAGRTAKVPYSELLTMVIQAEKMKDPIKFFNWLLKQRCKTCGKLMGKQGHNCATLNI